MAKEILYNEENIEALSVGVDKLADAVRITLGPRGRNVIFDQKYDIPLATNDGVTIAKQIQLDDPFENAGAEMIKEAAVKTNELTGDGTTAAVVIAHKLINQGIKNITSGANPLLLKKGIEAAAKIAVDALSKSAVKIDKKYLRQIATISGNNDPFIGDLVAEAFENVGLNGIVTVEDSQQMKTTLNHSNGIHIDNGYLSEYFINNLNNKTVEMDEPYILLVEDRIKKLQDILEVLEQAARKGVNLLIIAQDVEDEALTALALNAAKGALKVAAVKSPGYGDTRKRHMKALAHMLDGQLVTEDTGMKLENCGLEVCGRAKRVVIEKEKTVIQEPAGAGSEDVEKMLAQVRNQIERETADYEIEKLNVTISLLSGGISVITVGGATEIEMFERKYRIEDAVSAVYASVEQGVVAGGGKALLSTVPEVDAYIQAIEGDERTGAKILRDALIAPIRQIAENAGTDPGVVVDNVLRSDNVNYGFNALTMQYEDMIEAGIIDPLKVVKTSLLNAVSSATMLLTANVGVHKKEEKK